jgi:hypothetical protein
MWFDWNIRIIELQKVHSNIFFLFMILYVILMIVFCFYWNLDLDILLIDIKYILIFMEHIDKWIAQFLYKLIIISNVGLDLLFLLKSWSDEHCSCIRSRWWKYLIEISNMISFCPKSATKLLMWVNKNLEICRDQAFFKTCIFKVDGR